MNCVWLRGAASTIACILSLTGHSPAADEAPHARTLIEAAIGLRKQLGSGKLAIRVLNMNETHPIRWTLFFDERGHYRSDTSHNGNTDRLVIPHEIVTPKQVIVDYGRGDPIDVRSTPNAAVTCCFHPRIFGYVPSQIQALGQYGMNHLLLNHEYMLDERAVKSAVHGQGAWLCTARHKQDAKATIKTWVITEYGPVIAKIEADQGSGGDTRQVHSVESRYKKFGSVWFPETIDVLRTKGGSVTMQESATIESAEFGPVADKVFTLAGLELLEGRQVQIDGRETKYVRNGEVQSHAQIVVPVPSKSSASTVWLSRLAAVVIAVTGISLIVRRRKTPAT